MVQTRAMAHKAEAHKKEFAGVWGASGISFGLPILCYIFVFSCNDLSGCPAPSLLHPSTLSLDKLKEEVGWPGLSGLWNGSAFLAVLGYYTLSLILYAALPAQEVEGGELRNGGRWLYRLNAFPSLLVTMGIVLTGTLLQGSSFFLYDFIWQNYVQILTSNILVSYGLALFVYVRSFQVRPLEDPETTKAARPTEPSKTLTDNFPKRELAAGGHSGNILYDWFIGRELNPPVQIPLIGTVELKTFMEVRPGLLGWMILNFAFAAHQHKVYGTITPSMAIAVLTQALYVVDATYNESAILTQIDITTDGFGFMLAFGDLVWLPFTYSLQTRYLAIHPVRLTPLLTAVIATVSLTGFYIFRASNSQKNTFRTNPSAPEVQHLKYIQTKAGSRLLTSGWWGAARHINYLGDWLMSWAYVLPTGLAGYVIRTSSPFRDHPHVDNAALMRDDHSLYGGKEVVPGEAAGWGMLITYFYMVYFAVLLIHRERRDDEKCRNKYGKDWEEYCKQVPSRIIPGIY